MVKNFLKLYNHERKVRFLEEEYPNDGTRQTYSSVLINSAKFEEDKKKDICDFAYSDVVELMIGLKKKTVKSLDVAQSIFIKYSDWCIKEGYSKTNINAFKLLNKEDLSKYTHQIAQKNAYITREKLYEIANLLYNDVDKALLVLPFEGVRGRTEIDNSFEELRNLRFSDLMPAANTIIVTRNNGEKRAIKVHEKTMEILMRSMVQEDYHKNNGEGTGRFAIMPLKNTGYVVRTMEKSNSTEDKINISSLNTKFRNFRMYTGVQFLTPTLLFQSGLMEKCEKIEQELGQLQPENYRQIYRDLSLDERAWFSLKEMYEAYKKNKTSKS